MGVQKPMRVEYNRTETGGRWLDRERISAIRQNINNILHITSLAVAYALLTAVMLVWAVVGLAIANQHYLHARWGWVLVSVVFALFPPFVYLALNGQQVRAAARYIRRVRNTV